MKTDELEALSREWNELGRAFAKDVQAGGFGLVRSALNDDQLRALLSAIGPEMAHGAVRHRSGQTYGARGLLASNPRLAAHLDRQLVSQVASEALGIAGMASTANESAILYFNGEGIPNQLFLARLDPAGVRRVQDPIVAELTPSQRLLSPVVVNDGAYTFTWIGESAGSNSRQLHFGRAECP